MTGSPARLFSIMNSAFKISPNGKKTIKQTWAALFDVPESKYAEILGLHYEVVKLTQSAKAEITKHEELNSQLYIEPFEKIEYAFSVLSLNHQWGQVSPHVTDVQMKALEFCADVFSRKTTEQKISQDEITNLQKDIDQLISEVVKMDTDAILQSFLLARLEEMRKALLYYRINGASGLKETLESVIGAVFIFQAENENIDYTLDKWGKLGAIISSWFLKVSISTTAKLLVDNTVPLLFPHP